MDKRSERKMEYIYCRRLVPQTLSGAASVSAVVAVDFDLVSGF